MNNIFDSLPNGLGERAKQLIAEREAKGFNVHFINSSGKRDRHSFATAERANSFRAKLARMGLEEVQS
jgi:hypothetical protein